MVGGMTFDRLKLDSHGDSARFVLCMYYLDLLTSLTERDLPLQCLARQLSVVSRLLVFDSRRRVQSVFYN